MATKDYPSISADWIQITDGTQQAALQVLSGTLFLRDSATKPGKSEKGHLISGWIVITTPQQAWVRASSSTASAVVTYS